MENFNLLSFRYVESMDELSSNEKDLLLRYIREDHDLELDDDYDFFTNDDCDWLTDTIVVSTWQWKDKILIDIYGYPGDNTDGCIYMLEGDSYIPVARIDGNCDVCPTEECPPELAKDLPYLQHLRPNGDLECYEIYGPDDDNPVEGLDHSYCVKQHTIYCQLTGRSCHCPAHQIS